MSKTKSTRRPTRVKSAPPTVGNGPSPRRALSLAFTASQRLESLCDGAGAALETSDGSVPNEGEIAAAESMLILACAAAGEVRILLELAERGIAPAVAQ
jgi:hypothetical protein